MAWIESHQSLAKHPKTIRLAAALHLPRVTAIGHLHLLWWWAMDYAQNGDLTPFTDKEIAMAAEKPGKASEFCAALIDAGFIDLQDGKRLIHDWDQYFGKLLDRRRDNAERQRSHRLRNASHNSDVRRDVTRTSELRNGATVPNRTQPNPTSTPSVTEGHPPKPPRAGNGGGNGRSELDLFYAAYAEKVKELTARYGHPLPPHAVTERNAWKAEYISAHNLNVEA